VTKKISENPVHVLNVPFGAGELRFETGRLAILATGSVTVTYGDTVVLATAVVGDVPREGVDFFPLLVDYEERLYAAGKISGSRFIKREGRPSENAVLTARLIDRPIRPMFPKDFRNDVQVIVTVLSYDEDHNPDVVSIIAASAALALSHAPFSGPIAAARVGICEGKIVVNPTAAQMKEATLDLVVAGTADKVLMLEAGAHEVSEKEFLAAIEAAQKEFKSVIEAQKTLAKDSPEPIQITVDETLHLEVQKYLGEKLGPVAREADKLRRQEMISTFETEVLTNFEGNYKQIDLKAAFNTILEKEVRGAILADGFRPDARGLEEIRPLSAEVGVLPRTHGSGLFSRGQTQALTIATLGSPGDKQFIDTMEEEGTKRYMHHYNFPPFSVGEVKPVRGASRREIGHGALAERAILPVLPPADQFPYTIRLVTEVLSSNGSSSMAATCGSTLALMDAGVPISAPVAGIAIGLISKDPYAAEGVEADYQLLTDIQGIEDFAGDMDFKVAGTKTGITAVQLDMKVRGISLAVIEAAFERARTARGKILEFFMGILEKPRPELSHYAPRIYTVKIEPKKIGELIGPGGKVINGIIDAHGGKEVLAIDIEPDGTVMVSSADAKAADAAINEIRSITAGIEVGQIYTGTVAAIQTDRLSGKEIGAIVQLTPNKDGMVHISQISAERINKVSDAVKVGEKVQVRVQDVDEARGRISLTMRVDEAPSEPKGFSPRPPRRN